MIAQETPAKEQTQPALDQDTIDKLLVLKEKLGANDLQSALDKSLNIANDVADTINDDKSKLLVERNGKFVEWSGIR